MHHGSGADFDMAADSDAAYDHGPGADEAMVADLRRFAVRFSDGDILINAAVGADSGISGDIYAVQAVGEGEESFDDGAVSQVSPVPTGCAVEKKGQDISRKPVLCVLPPALQPPKAAQVVPLGIIGDPRPKRVPHKLSAMAWVITCSRRSPAACIIRGNRL